MKNKKIIFVGNSLGGGGAERVLSLLANAFDNEGYEVGVLAFHRRKNEYSLNPSVGRQYGPHGRGVRAKLKRVHWIRRTAKQNPEARLISFEYFVNILTLVACFGLKNRVVASERNDPARVGNHFPADAARKFLYRTAHTLVCQTEDAAAYFSDSIRKRVILNPLKPNLPEPFVGTRRNSVVTFCRLEKQKNLPLLVRAFAAFHKRYPEYTLEIYGNGGERESLESLVASLSLSDQVAIFPARDDIHDLARDCSMFVLPSDYEGLSNSMLEAMALGLPTICTDCPCGGARTVIRDRENGILVPVGDEQRLADALTAVASDSQLADRLSTNSRSIRQQLSLGTIVSEWKQVLF